MIDEFDPITQEAWLEDCLHWRGEVLTGMFSHWCLEWDMLPVDETCGNEWMACHCFTQDELEKGMLENAKNLQRAELRETLD